MKTKAPIRAQLWMLIAVMTTSWLCADKMDSAEPIQIRQVPNEIWERPAISYSGYRAGQSPDTGISPSDEEVIEDLTLLEKEGFGLIRTYSSRAHGAQVVRLIHEKGFDIKVQVGAYLSGKKELHAEFNQSEVENAVMLANKYPEVVMGVSVGNENLVSWSFVAVPPEEMIEYIQFVRERIKQPVTVNDNWEPYAAPLDSPIHQVWHHIDYASVHTYAYWDAGYNLWPFRQLEVDASKRFEAVMEASFEYAKDNFHEVRKALDAGGISIPIVIGETGWQSLPSAKLDGAPSQDFAELLAGTEAQTWYFDAMVEWSLGEDGKTAGNGQERPCSVFYFSSFDEPWKNADDNWGLWDANRKPKPVIRK
jgi:exo-beta-1,3-glucanase (GH17 family)